MIYEGLGQGRVKESVYPDFDDCPIDRSIARAPQSFVDTHHFLLKVQSQLKTHMNNLAP